MGPILWVGQTNLVLTVIPRFINNLLTTNITRNFPKGIFKRTIHANHISKFVGVNCRSLKFRLMRPLGSALERMVNYAA